MMLKRLIVVMGVILLAIMPAYAAEVVIPTSATSVRFDWGDLVNVFLIQLASPQSVIWTITGLVVTWLLAKLPGPLQWAFRTFQVEQIFNRAIQASMNGTAGAVKGQALTVDVGSEVIAKAASYVLEHASAGLVNWIGGRAGAEEKVLARINLVAEADGPTVLAKAATAPDSLR